MSRSGYTEDYDETFPNATYLYRANLERAMAGKRGQAFLKDLLAQFDAMSEKRLITGELEENGQVCALGVIARARGLDTSKLKRGEIDEYDEGEDDEWVIDNLSAEFDITESMVREIMFENDEGTYRTETPEDRWHRMRRWVASHIKS